MRLLQSRRSWPPRTSTGGSNHGGRLRGSMLVADGDGSPSPSHLSISARTLGCRSRTRRRSSLMAVTIKPNARSPSNKPFMIFPCESMDSTREDRIRVP